MADFCLGKLLNGLCRNLFHPWIKDRIFADNYNPKLTPGSLAEQTEVFTSFRKPWLDRKVCLFL